MVSISQLHTINNSSEPNPWLVKNGYLYFGQNFGGNPNGEGYIKKLKLDDLTETTIYGPRGKWAMWKAVYDIKNNRLIAVGEANDDSGIQRAGILIINLADDTAQLVLHPNTGDTNEFIGAMLDYINNRLIVGERASGGGTTGSNWPNGGGLWTIPLDTLTDPSTWNRIYENPDGCAWKNIVYFKGLYYASLYKGGTLVKIISSSDLQSWSDVETSNSSTVTSGLDADDEILAYSIVDTNGNVVVKWTTDGSTWNSVTVATAPANGSAQVRIVGKYILVFIGDKDAKTTDVYIINTEDSSVNSLASGLAGYMAENDGYFDGQQNMYFGLSMKPDTPSYIYQLVFDAKRVLSLALSKSNPAPGETITIEATLLDENGSPVADVDIEFYVINASKTPHVGVGDLIGVRTTDANGRASVQYTMPSTAQKVWFRAIYKG